jgi:hypothetical protein
MLAQLEEDEYREQRFDYEVLRITGGLEGGAADVDGASDQVGCLQEGAGLAVALLGVGELGGGGCTAGEGVARLGGLQQGEEPWAWLAALLPCCLNACRMQSCALSLGLRAKS